MYKVGDTVKVKYNGKIGAIIAVEQSQTAPQYVVLVDGKKARLYAEQIVLFDDIKEIIRYSSKDVNALFTARLLLNPNINSLYSLNSSKIDYIPYQFRPVLKIIKSESPRILIADGVGVGKTIEAGLILKELEARFDIKSVLVICPRPLITEKKWQNELKDKFGEKFVHIDGDKLRYCIQESYLEEEWPDDYAKCVIPYSLFDEAIVCGTADNGLKKLNKKSFADLKPFPKFDLVIIDEAHHIKNPNTYAYQAVQMFCENASSIVMLTATPIQLGDKDLFVLLHLLDESLQLNLGLGWNTLSLCPNCAAKFKYSQITISSLIEQAQHIDINAAQSSFFDISINLEGKPTTVRFTPKHLLALQVAIKKIKEIEKSDDKV